MYMQYYTIHLVYSLSLSISYSILSAQHHSHTSILHFQCDQIRQLLKGFGHNFYYQNSLKNVIDFEDYFEERHVLNTNSYGYFLATFGRNGLLFCLLSGHTVIAYNSLTHPGKLKHPAHVSDTFQLAYLPTYHCLQEPDLKMKQFSLKNDLN